MVIRGIPIPVYAKVGAVDPTGDVARAFSDVHRAAHRC